MRTGQILKTGVSGLGLFVAVILTGCENGTSSAQTDQSMTGGNELSAIPDVVPPSARIGNIASAEIQPTEGSDVTGTATFAAVDNGLMITMELTGVAAGPHGVHLHQQGDCSAPDASSAGGHFSPDGDPHGSPESASGQHHAGDLGNLMADAAGTAEFKLTDPELALAGEYGVTGRAVIVHERADDLSSQPSGDAGRRVACGVIEYGSNLTG